MNQAHGFEIAAGHGQPHFLDFVAQLHDSPLPGKPRQDLKPDPGGLIKKPVTDLAQRTIPDRGEDLRVQPDIDLSEHTQRHTLVQLVAFHRQFIQCLEHFRRRRDRLGVPDGFREDGPHVINIQQVLEVDGGDRGTDALPAFHQAIRRQAAQYMPDGGAADAEFHGEILLAKHHARRRIKQTDAAAQSLKNAFNADLRLGERPRRGDTGQNFRRLFFLIHIQIHLYTFTISNLYLQSSNSYKVL